MDVRDLRGRTLLVKGAGRGIGKETAFASAGRGATPPSGMSTETRPTPTLESLPEKVDAVVLDVQARVR